MAKYLSVEKVLDLIDDVDMFCSENCETNWYAMLRQAVVNAPLDDVKPVRHGMWIKEPKWHGYHCSECGMRRSYIEAQTISYCPNCGAEVYLCAE